MKNTLLAFSLCFFIVLLLASCKRDFNCACTTTTKINDSVTSISYVKEQYRTTRNKAKGWCSDWATTNISGNDTTVTTNDCMFE